MISYRAARLSPSTMRGEAGRPALRGSRPWRAPLAKAELGGLEECKHLDSHRICDPLKEAHDVCQQHGHRRPFEWRARGHHAEVSVPALYTGPVDATGFFIFNPGGWGPAIIANFRPLIWFLLAGITMLLGKASRRRSRRGKRSHEGDR